MNKDILKELSFIIFNYYESGFINKEYLIELGESFFGEYVELKDFSNEELIKNILKLMKSIIESFEDFSKKEELHKFLATFYIL